MGECTSCKGVRPHECKSPTAIGELNVSAKYQETSTEREGIGKGLKEHLLAVDVS